MNAPTSPAILLDTIRYEKSVRKAESSLSEFTKQAWHVIEPGTEYIHGWHVDAISDHLEAVTDGEIRNLIINMPPRHMKSILVSVMWPVWTWIDRPEYRWLFASYAGSLSVRDSLKCRRLITSKWFQDRWGHLFKLTGDQNAKILFENDKYGYRFATSVGASATGHGGDTIVCFPGYEVVNTERGPLAIGEIVNNHIEVKVLATDVSTGETAYKNITGWHVNPGRPLVRVHTADGHFDCTEDHRVWTANRGWVAAADLTESDDLPGSPVLDRPHVALANTEFAGYFTVGVARFKNFVYDLSRNLKVATIRMFLSTLPKTAPCSPGPDLIDVSPTDPEFGGGFGPRPDKLADFNDLALSEDRAGAGLGESSVFNRVVDVVGIGPVRNVAESVVRRVAVKVSNYVRRLRLGADERSRHSLVKVNDDGLPASSGVESPIALAVLGWLDKPFFSGTRDNFVRDFLRKALDSAGVGNLVKPLEPDHRKPLFVERIGHCDTSYCISVSDYCTFYVGVCQVLVSNCDDPHNSIEAQSDAMRETALTWWDQSMSTRLNDPKVGSKVIVMQRLHERDLSGHVLKQGGYEHLCLPAEYESASKMTSIGWVDPRSRKGELLCPERFGRDEIEDLKIRLGEYGTAGQLQQRPSPLGGGILKVAHFQKWRGAIPALDFVLQSYDTAYTERTEGDPTACTVWGCFTTKDGKRGVLLMDSWDDHLSYPKLRKRVIDDWKAIYGGNETRKGKKADAMLIEKKGSGQSLIQDLQGANIPVFTYDPGRADKKQRAHLVAPILEMDCVYILESEKRPGEFISWAQPFVDTVGKFPNDEHDDYVDTFTQAMIHLRDSGYLELPWFEGDEIEEIDFSKKKKGNPYAA